MLDSLEQQQQQQQQHGWVPPCFDVGGGWINSVADADADRWISETFSTPRHLFFCQLLLCNFVQDETIVSILNDNTFYAWKRRSIDGSCEFLSSVTPKSFDQIPVILSESKPLPYHVINKPWWLFHFIWSFVIPFFAVDLDHDHGCLHGLLSYVTLL